MSGLNSEGSLSELLLLPRRPGIRIPRELRLIFEWEEGKEEGYVVRFQDGTMFGRYPLKRLFLKHHTGLLEKLVEDGDSGWALGEYLERLVHEGLAKKEKVEIHKLAVHMCNVRHKPIDLNNVDDAAFNRLVGLARDGMLIYPLIVVELDSETAKSFRVAAEVAKKYGYDSDEVLTGWLWRKVRSEGDEKEAKIVAKEEDEVYSAVSEFYRRKGKEPPDGSIKYLIIDGYQRYVAYCYLKLKELDSWKVVPKVPVYVIRSGSGVSFVMDPLSTALLSMKANESQRDLLTDERDREAFVRFLKFFEGIDVALEKLGEKLKHEGIASTGRGLRAGLSPTRLPAVSEESPEHPRLQYHIGYIEAEVVQPPVAEEGRREERRWERKEEPKGRADVSEVQRQLAPTPSYAPAQPQPSAQTPISPQAQPIREEALRPGALPSYVEVNVPFDVKVLASLLDKFKDSILYWDWGKGGEVEMEMKFSFSAFTPTMREWLKRWPKEQSKLVRLVEFANKPVEVDGFTLLASGRLPFCVKEGAKGEPVLATCPNCDIPVPLIPICPKCLKPVRSDLLLPYEFAFKPE